MFGKSIFGKKGEIVILIIFGVTIIGLIATFVYIRIDETREAEEKQALIAEYNANKEAEEANTVDANPLTEEEISELAEYSIIDSEDISIPGKTRRSFWVSISPETEPEQAKLIARYIAQENSADEVTVWMYDMETETDMEVGVYVWNQMYSAVVEDGVISEFDVNTSYHGYSE